MLAGLSMIAIGNKTSISRQPIIAGLVTNAGALAFIIGVATAAIGIYIKWYV